MPALRTMCGARHRPAIGGCWPVGGAVDEGLPAEAEALPGLTPREREVLTHIVAGRTYGEIARELVLSEKTVSVHVSHLLHKTGTANRVELAQLARRVAKAADN